MPPPSRPASPIASDAADRGCAGAPMPLPRQNFSGSQFPRPFNPRFGAGFFGQQRQRIRTRPASFSKARLNRLLQSGADDPAGSAPPLSQALLCHQTLGRAHPAAVQAGGPQGTAHAGQQLRGFGIGACCADAVICLHPPRITSCPSLPAPPARCPGGQTGIRRGGATRGLANRRPPRKSLRMTTGRIHSCCCITC